MKIYYAHPMSWYGTAQEEADLAYLHMKFPNDIIVNPNSPYFDALVQQAKQNGTAIMNVFADYIHHRADRVIARPFTDGKMGSGVAREVFEAHIAGKPYHQLIDSSIYGRLVVGFLDVVDQTLSLVETQDRTRRGQL